MNTTMLATATNVELLSELKPYYDEAILRQDSKQSTDLDNRVCTLYKKIEKFDPKNHNIPPSNTLDSPYSFLDEVLTLTDFKTVMACGEKVEKVFTAVFKLQDSIDHVNTTFYCRDRIEKTSQHILQEISIRSFRTEYDPNSSPSTKLIGSRTWCALSSDHEIASMNSSKITEGNRKIIFFRMKEIEEKNQGSNLLNNLAKVYASFFINPEVSVAWLYTSTEHRYLKIWRFPKTNWTLWKNVNDLPEYCLKFCAEDLLPERYKELDVAVLERSQIERFFPGFSQESLQENASLDPQEVLNRKERCIQSAKSFTQDQMNMLKHNLLPEVQRLLSEERLLP